MLVKGITGRKNEKESSKKQGGRLRQSKKRYKFLPKGISFFKCVCIKRKEFL